MRCESARELLSEYAEGSIQAAIRIPLETHLSECGDCRTEADGLREVWRMLDSAPVMDAPADLRAVVWARIDAQQQARTQRKPAFRPAWSAILTRKALGWGAALLAVVALASVTIPGKYSTANFFPWMVSKQAAEVSVRAGAPTHITAPGVDDLKVGLQWTGDIPSKPTITVESGPATVSDSSADSVTLALHPGAAKRDIVLRVQWTDEGRTESRTLTVHTP